MSFCEIKRCIHFFDGDGKVLNQNYVPFNPLVVLFNNKENNVCTEYNYDRERTLKYNDLLYPMYVLRYIKTDWNLILRAFISVESSEEVPGASPQNCGNYLMHNLTIAKWYAKRFADYLTENAGKSEIFEYPKTERLVTDDGRHFFDS